MAGKERKLEIPAKTQKKGTALAADPSRIRVGTIEFALAADAITNIAWPERDQPSHVKEHLLDEAGRYGSGEMLEEVRLYNEIMAQNAESH